ncbi:MAG: ASKHA domain-containing protein [Candidatus Omnitrophica bacterium]|nr:ASKHA domain-containing protein [Candidatus Omnitrophota bacterium]
MNERVRIELRPLGRVIEVPLGTPLHEVLFAHGVEFPCGGQGRCRGCRVKLLAGQLPITPDEESAFTPAELEAGWRLACRIHADTNLTLELAQWEASILTDNSIFDFRPRDGLGVAVDLGTTTLVAQLLDRRTGHVLAVRTALNAQALHGADIMSRVNYALADDGRRKLEQLIREQIGELILELGLAANRPVEEVAEVVVVGNTVMHHLFCGLNLQPLSHYPFESPNGGPQVFRAEELGWNRGVRSTVRFQPCLGGFVGSDILAGILATRLHQSRELVGLIDLGTNGEIVLGNQDRILCASTAAGPAFEGARLSMGMRAATGAISKVMVHQGGLECKVLGEGPARGVCGSGLVDAIAAGLDLGWIQPSGRLTDKKQTLVLCPPVTLNQADVRQLQLAKAAIAAGIRILLEKWGAKPSDVHKVYLAGAFGNYINRSSARRIGLYEFHLDQVQPAGNTALLGAKLALFAPPDEDYSFSEVRSRVQHLSLNEDPHFQDIFLDEIGFPQQ